jgi:hypothetical protein
MPPTNDPLAALHAVPRGATSGPCVRRFRVAMFRHLDRLAAKANAEAAREAAKEAEVAA